jgi:hypothetical protein
MVFGWGEEKRLNKLTHQVSSSVSLFSSYKKLLVPWGFLIK